MNDVRTNLHLQNIMQGVQTLQDLGIDKLPPEEQEKALEAITTPMHGGGIDNYRQRSGRVTPKLQSEETSSVQNGSDATPRRWFGNARNHGNTRERLEKIEDRGRDFYTGVGDTLGMLVGIAPSYTEESLQGRFPVFEQRNGRPPSTRSEIEQALYMETVLTDTNAAKDVNRDRIGAETTSAIDVDRNRIDAETTSAIDVDRNRIDAETASTKEVMSHETGELRTRGDEQTEDQAVLHSARQAADARILQSNPSLQSSGSIAKFSSEDERSGTLPGGWADDIFDRVVTDQFISLKAPSISQQITQYTDGGMQITEAMTNLDPEALKEAFYQIIENMGWDQSTVTAAKVEAEGMNQSQIVNVIMGLASMDDRVIARYKQEVEARINTADEGNAELYNQIATTALEGKQRYSEWQPSTARNPSDGVYLRGDELSKTAGKIRRNFDEYFTGLPDVAPEEYERGQEDAYNLIRNMLNEFSEKELQQADTSSEELEAELEQLSEYGWREHQYWDMQGREALTRPQFVDIPNSDIDRLIEIQKRLDQMRSAEIDLWTQYSGNQ